MTTFYRLVWKVPETDSKSETEEIVCATLIHVHEDQTFNTIYISPVCPGRVQIYGPREGRDTDPNSEIKKIEINKSEYELIRCVKELYMDTNCRQRERDIERVLNNAITTMMQKYLTPLGIKLDNMWEYHKADNLI